MVSALLATAGGNAAVRTHGREHCNMSAMKVFSQEAGWVMSSLLCHDRRCSFGAHLSAAARKDRSRAPRAP